MDILSESRSQQPTDRFYNSHNIYCNKLQKEIPSFTLIPTMNRTWTDTHDIKLPRYKNDEYMLLEGRVLKGDILRHVWTSGWP